MFPSYKLYFYDTIFPVDNIIKCCRHLKTFLLTVLALRSSLAYSSMLTTLTVCIDVEIAESFCFVVPLNSVSKDLLAQQTLC